MLESNGKSVTIQAWDFNAGENFVKNIDAGLTECNQMLIILSDNYLNSYWCQEEWTSKLKEQVDLQERKIIPIRISPVKPVGLLGTLVYIDIVDKTQEEAISLILEGIKDRKERISKGFIPYYNVEHMQIDLDYIVTCDKIIFIKQCRTKILEDNKRSIHNRITWFADEKIEIKSLLSNSYIENIGMKDTNHNFNVVFNKDLRQQKYMLLNYLVNIICFAHRANNSVRYYLRIEQFLADNFFSAIADAIHHSNPLHLVGGFELLSYAFGFCHLFHQLKKHFFGLLIHTFKVIVQRAIHSHNIYDGWFVFS